MKKKNVNNCPEAQDLEGVQPRPRTEVTFLTPNLSLDGKSTKNRRLCKSATPTSSQPSNHTNLFRKKSQMGQTGDQQQLPTFEEQLDGNYSKIHKMLATNNKNKDLRENLKGHLNEREENKLSPNMWLTLNPVRIRSLLIRVYSNTTLTRSLSLPSRTTSQAKSSNHLL